ncbi:MAG: helix-turn-helix domain-containing protein [Erysipelothrix sp.]
MAKPRGKYVKWQQPKNLMLLESWARKLTNEQIAANIGIAPKTLYAWMNKYPEIREAVERGKEVVVSEVENALLKRATGYTETVDKVKVLNDGGIVRYKEDVHYPPDTTAAIFALKNMDPASWRDKQEVQHSGNDGTAIKINIVPDKDD